MKPKISVITPSYNLDWVFHKTAQSVLAQSYPNFEWIIIDDNSTDNTWEVVSALALKDPRIKCIRTPRNMGASFTRNLGINNANGEYLAFLDGDDLWEPNKLEAQIAYMESNHLNFSYHAYRLIDINDSVTKSISVPTKTGYDEIIRFNPIFTSSVMLKADSLKGIQFREELRRRQDYVFWFDLMKDGIIAHGMQESLACYRVGNSESLSANKLKMSVIQWEIYRDVFKLPLHTSVVSLWHYAINGIKKYS